VNETLCPRPRSLPETKPSYLLAQSTTRKGVRNAYSDFRRPFTRSRRCRVSHPDLVLTCCSSERQGSDIFRTICSSAQPNEKTGRRSHVGGVTSVKSSSGRLMLPLIGCGPITPPATGDGSSAAAGYTSGVIGAGRRLQINCGPKFDHRESRAVVSAPCRASETRLDRLRPLPNARLEVGMAHRREPLPVALPRPPRCGRVY